MKPTILSTIFSLLFISFTLSQNDTDEPSDSDENVWNFAVKGGLNYSRTNGDVSSNNQYLADFHLGAVISIPTGFNFDIQAEPVISRIGDRVDGDPFRRYTFLDIPVLARVFTEDIVSVEVGPKIALNLDERARRDGELEKTDRIKTLTFGIVAGATVTIDQNWFGQFRFNYTPMDIVTKDGGDTEGTDIVLFQLGVGYWFN